MSRKQKFLDLSQHNGLTLIELLITLTIAGILITIAVPNFSTLAQNNLVSTQSNEFLTALSIARSEALKRNRNVTISANTADQWEDGWTISDNTGTAIFVNNGFSAATTLTNTNGTNAVTFNSRGFLTSGAQTIFNLDVTDAPKGRSITISPSGSSNIAITTPTP